MSERELGMIASASAELNELCQKVGLQLADELPRTEGGVQLPPGAAIWSGSYAHVLLWPLGSAEPAEIERGAVEAEGWLDEVLSRLDRGSIGMVDGYLVLALPEPPHEEAKDDIRKIELSARICRKHLIWPMQSPDGELNRFWSRISDITVLGLPDVNASSSGGLHWPGLDGEAQAVWVDISTLGARATAQKDVEL